MCERKTGLWKVTSQYLGDQMKYAVCRIINTDEVEHNGNREYSDHGYMTNRKIALAIASALNQEEQLEGQGNLFPTA